MNDFYFGLSTEILFSINPNPTIDNSLSFLPNMALHEKLFFYLTPNTKYYVRAYIIDYYGMARLRRASEIYGVNNQSSKGKMMPNAYTSKINLQSEKFTTSIILTIFAKYLHK